MADEYRDVIERLKEDGYDNEAEILEKYDKNQLRDRAKKADGAITRVKELEDELAAVRAAPKRMEVLKAARVDVSSLRPSELEVIERARPAEGREYDSEWARELIEKYALPVSEGEEEVQSEEAGPRAMVEAATSVTGGAQGPASKTRITPQEANEWSASKRMRFFDWCEQNGSDAFDRLLRGETVVGITFD